METGWQQAYEAGECAHGEAVAGAVHKVAPPAADRDAPIYAELALEADCALALYRGEARVRAWRALTRPAFERLLAAGVSAPWLMNLNVAGDIGTARVDLLARGARFQVGGPDPRLLLAVRDAAYQITDVVALASHDENQWALLTGEGAMLGAWHLEAAHEFVARCDHRAARSEGGEGHYRLQLHATPWDWLRSGGTGICVLEWSAAALAELRGLRGGRVAIVVASGAAATGGRERLRALLRHGDLPTVVEERAGARQAG